MINEKVMFSQDVENVETGLMKLLVSGSVSEKDAQIRVREYGKMFANQESVREIKKAFSGYADNEILANQYYAATVNGLAQSIAGFVTMERALDQPEGLFYWYDLLNLQGDTVMANIGKDNLGNYSNRITTKVPVVAATAEYPVSLLKKVLPGTVKIQVVKNGQVVYEITDNKKGVLNAPAGVLATGSVVNYTSGSITVKFATGVAENGMTLNITAIHDQIQTANVNRFKKKLRHFMMNAYPEVLIGEADLPSIAAANKSLGIDPNELLYGDLRELYTKIVNADIVRTVVYNYQGDSHQINFSSWTDFRSKLDEFTAELQVADTLLMKKSDKGVKATSYITGETGLNLFKQCKDQ